MAVRGRTEELVERITAAGLIAVIRADSADKAIRVSRALHAGGVEVLEIAMTTPGGVDAVRMVADELGDTAIIGAGTVLSSRTAHAVVEAGAEFVFAPNTDEQVIETVKSLDRAVVPGALTPTEVARAMNAGADLIKLFPANVFGPGYIKDLKGPYPTVRITPTGGVTADNMNQWFAAGAEAVGVGTAMIRKDLVREQRWDELTGVAEQYVEAVRRAR